MCYHYCIKLSFDLDKIQNGVAANLCVKSHASFFSHLINTQGRKSYLDNRINMTFDVVCMQTLYKPISAKLGTVLGGIIIHSLMPIFTT